MPSYIFERGVKIPMRDGTELVADVYRTEVEFPRPVLLQRLPYNRSLSFMTQAIQSLEVTRALDAGFSVVIQDCRGRFESRGSFYPFATEAEDGYDTIEWIREQEWCNRLIGMWGASYIGATQVLAAMQSPPGLVAIAPQETGSEYYDGWTYEGGALQLAFVLLWVIEALGGADVARDDDDQLRGCRQALLDELMRDPEAVFSRLPTNNDELARVAPYFRDWLRHDRRDTYWAELSPSTDSNRITAAALHIAGWHDIFLRGSLKNFQSWRSDSQSREHQYLIIGPWAHGNLSDWQGDDWLGYGASAGGFDLNAAHLDFFRATMMGAEIEIPRVRFHIGGVNEWRSADEWPPQSSSGTLYLVGSGSAASLSDGRLMTHPGSQGEDSWISSPQNPVPTVGGRTFLPGALMGKNSGPRSQNAVDSRPDVAIYTSEPLADFIEVVGEVVGELFASSSATDCDWVMRLVDVFPDGSSRSVADGVLRAKCRDGLEKFKPLTPGETYRYVIDLGSVAYRFDVGHRIRVQVCSSNFPRFDRNPQQFMSVADAVESDFRDATQTVFSGGDTQSSISLPLLVGRLP